MRSTRAIVALAGTAAVIALLAYLRDPPWLLHVSSGLGAWRTDQSGIRYRPMGGHASFFVPADAATLTFQLRAPFESPDDWPISATICVDDRLVERVLLNDDMWRVVTLDLRRPTRRRVRRIDIHADRTRSFNYGPDVGEPDWTAR